MEQKLTSRLIRPSARYVGHPPRPVGDIPGAAEALDPYGTV
jgi:citrate synthase